MFVHGDAKPLWPAILFLPMLCIGLLILRDSLLYRARERTRSADRALAQRRTSVTWPAS